jgi:hypothetical protein
MRPIQIIGRLHYLVPSDSRADLDHIVDLEPQIIGDQRFPFWCGCESFNLSHELHSTPCRHMRRIVKELFPEYLKKYD